MATEKETPKAEPKAEAHRETKEEKAEREREMQTRRATGELREAARVKEATSDMVRVPYLRRQLVSGGRSYGPSETPVDVPLGVAISAGFSERHLSKAGGKASGERAENPHLPPYTEPGKAETADDDSGRLLGGDIPVVDQRDLPPSAADREAAAKLNGRDEEAAKRTADALHADPKAARGSEARKSKGE